MRCPACGAEMSDGAVFCANCGARLGEASEQAQVGVEDAATAKPWGKSVTPTASPAEPTTAVSSDVSDATAAMSTTQMPAGAWTSVLGMSSQPSSAEQAPAAGQATAAMPTVPLASAAAADLSASTDMTVPYAPVEAASPAAPTPLPAPAPGYDDAAPASRSARSKMPLIAAIAAVLVLAVVLVAVALRGRGTGGAASETPEVAEPAQDVPEEDPAEEEPAADEAPEAEVESSSPPAPSSIDFDPALEPVVYTSPCARVTMPRELADLGYEWQAREQGMGLWGPSGSSYVAGIAWDERAGMDEFKEERYELGTVRDGGTDCRILLVIPYVDENGHVLAGMDTREPYLLACEYYLGLSAEDILSWIEVFDAPDATPAAPQGVSSRTTPYWGVWAFASKDLGEATDFARSMYDAGFFGTEVFVTTDWDNLNSEPWYVVSLACCSSEGEAEGVRQDAAYAGHDDAYVKYSGAYVG